MVKLAPLFAILCSFLASYSQANDLLEELESFSPESLYLSMAVLIETTTGDYHEYRCARPEEAMLLGMTADDDGTNPYIFVTLRCASGDYMLNLVPHRPHKPLILECKGWDEVMAGKFENPKCWEKI